MYLHSKNPLPRNYPAVLLAPGGAAGASYPLNVGDAPHDQSPRLPSGPRAVAVRSTAASAAGIDGSNAAPPPEKTSSPPHPVRARLCGAAPGGPFRAALPAWGKTLLSANLWPEFTNTKNMKTKPTKIDRSGPKWLPGAMALAATTAGSQAATVQITLTGNKISTLGEYQLNSDLTGDGTADVVILSRQVGAGEVWVVLGPSSNQGKLSAKQVHGFGVMYYGDAQFRSGGVGTSLNTAATAGGAAVYLNPIVFQDANINGGLATQAWLEVTAVNIGWNDHSIELTRLIFDDGNTTRPGFTTIPGVLPLWQVAAVPEPSGFLATSLLLGAAGLIRRRQARAA